MKHHRAFHMAHRTLSDEPNHFDETRDVHQRAHHQRTQCSSHPEPAVAVVSPRQQKYGAHNQQGTLQRAGESVGHSLDFRRSRSRYKAQRFFLGLPFMRRYSGGLCHLPPKPP